MTENENIKKHIEECGHRIGNILGFMVSNSDADISSCENNIAVLKEVIIALEEIQSCRAIGTVEEFKDLKEKAEPKKIVYQVGKNGLKHEKCHTCGSFHVFGRYCSECGQKLDWGKGEKQ